ncbi:unnamed protein product [Nyctereutes procyonoides]|uniref:(raccoon dog) hypothetical protein n=1 Tax=Nyctereutes procyonoides TaxID=34880 RepID=A0A811XW63_NYCPR|nr:unnamed protein product [Nyctereutes procyonoides]
MVSSAALPGHGHEEDCGRAEGPGEGTIQFVQKGRPTEGEHGLHLRRAGPRLNPLFKKHDLSSVPAGQGGVANDLSKGVSEESSHTGNAGHHLAFGAVGIPK